MVRGLVKGKGQEYFVYATEGYNEDGPLRLRRFVYRVDGFVSVRSPKPRSWGEAGTPEGAIVTPPLIFAGKQLVINYTAWQSGSVRVELEDDKGHAIEGLTLADCVGLRGDAVDQQVAWQTAADLGAYAGRPVRLRFALQHAELFSFQFVE